MMIIKTEICNIFNNLILYNVINIFKNKTLQTLQQNYHNFYRSLTLILKKQNASVNQQIKLQSLQFINFINYQFMYQTLLPYQNFQKLLLLRLTDSKIINYFKNLVSDRNWNVLRTQLNKLGALFKQQQIVQILQSLKQTEERILDQTNLGSPPIPLYIVKKQYMIKGKINQIQVSNSISLSNNKNQNQLFSVKIQNQKGIIIHRFRSTLFISLAQLKKLLKPDYSDIDFYVFCDKKLNRYSQTVTIQDCLQNSLSGQLNLILKKQTLKQQESKKVFEQIKFNICYENEKKYIKNSIIQINRMQYYVRDLDNKNKIQQWRSLLNSFQKIHGNSLQIFHKLDEILNINVTDNFEVQKIVENQKKSLISSYNQKNKILRQQEGRGIVTLSQYLNTKLDGNLLKGRIIDNATKNDVPFQLIKALNGINIHNKQNQQYQDKSILSYKQQFQDIKDYIQKLKSHVHNKNNQHKLLIRKDQIQDPTKKKQFFAYLKNLIIPTKRINFDAIQLQYTTQVIERISKIVQQINYEAKMQRLIYQFFKDYGTHFNTGMYSLGGIFMLCLSINEPSKQEEFYLKLMTKFSDLFFNLKGSFINNQNKNTCQSPQFISILNTLVQYKISIDIIKTGQVVTDNICDWKILTQRNLKNWIVLNQQEKYVTISSLILNKNNLIEFTKRGINKTDLIFLQNKMEKIEKSISSIGFKMFENLSDQILMLKVNGELKLQNKIVFKQNSNIEFYNGVIQSQKKQGFGIQQYYNGSRYVGNWKEDMWDGYGLYYLKNGGYYQGQFLNGKQQGKGRRVFQNGNFYSGIWKNNKYHGFGRLQRINGTYFEGIFSNGDAIQGKCVLFNNTGEKYQGSLKSGKYYNYGQYTWRDGSKYEGLFIQGKLQGRGKLWIKNEIIIQGNFKSNIASGVCRVQSKDQNGNQISEYINFDKVKVFEVEQLLVQEWNKTKYKLLKD